MESSYYNVPERGRLHIKYIIHETAFNPYFN